MDFSVLDYCNIDEITDGIEQLHGLENAARRHLPAYIAAYDRRGAWEQDGARSMADWLSMRLGLSLATARRLLAMSHVLERLPALAAPSRRASCHGTSWGPASRSPMKRPTAR